MLHRLRNVELAWPLRGRGRQVWERTRYFYMPARVCLLRGRHWWGLVRRRDCQHQQQHRGRRHITRHRREHEVLDTQQQLRRGRRETRRIDEINALDTPDSSKLLQFCYRLQCRVKINVRDLAHMHVPALFLTHRASLVFPFSSKGGRQSCI